MALKGEQGLKMDHPDHRNVELGQLAEASSRVLEMEGKNQALQGTVPELQGDSLALQESSTTYTELQKENQQLREQVEELGIQLRNEKENSQHLNTLKEQQWKLIDTLRLYRPKEQQEAEEKQLEELREQQKQLTEVQAALLQEQEAKARVDQENESLRQEVASLTSWTELLHRLNRELVDSQPTLLQNFQTCQDSYNQALAEKRYKETMLTKVREQFEDLEVECRHLRSQIDALKERNQSLLEERAGTWTGNKKDGGGDSLKTMPTGKAEEEHVITDPQEAQGPAPRTRKRWSRGRAFLRFFQRQRDSSRGQAKSPAESPPGSLEATPACSCCQEEKHARSGPPPKATGPQRSAFWSRKKKDEVKDKPPGASSTWSNLLSFCTC